MKTLNAQREKQIMVNRAALEKAEDNFKKAEKDFNAGKICFKKFQKAKSKLRHAQDRVTKILK